MVNVETWSGKQETLQPFKNGKREALFHKRLRCRYESQQEWRVRWRFLSCPISVNRMTLLQIDKLPYTMARSGAV